VHRLDLKAFGEPVAARDADRQTGEIHISIIRRLSRTHGVRLLIHEPLLRPRHSRYRPRGTKPKGTGAVTPQAAFLQQCPLTGFLRVTVLLSDVMSDLATAAVPRHPHAVDTCPGGVCKVARAQYPQA